MINNQRQTNILRIYHQATASEIDAGLRWYADARDEAIRLSKEILSSQTVAAVIAAVSPGLRWERNIEAAERIIRGDSLDGLGVRWYDGVRKAEAIIRGRNPLHVLKGNKVRAFYQCIAFPDSLSVCIDGHAYSIWAGERITLDDVPVITDRLYVKIAADYVQTARHIGVKPYQLQAITWCVWRRLHAV